jgi:hypothetical protein
LELGITLFIIFSAQGKSIISDTARFMMKLLLKLQLDEPSRLEETVSELETTRRFSELLHHFDSIVKDERRMKTIMDIRAELIKYKLKELPDDEKEFVRLGGKVYKL